MRQFINIVEGATRKLYHGSRNNLPVGTLLTPQLEGYVHATGMDAIERMTHTLTEKYLEEHRPHGATPRGRAVFLIDDPDDIDNAGGYNDFVYEVEPQGPLWKANLHWYSRLYLLCEDDNVDPEEAGRLAQSYWAAAPSQRDLFEYLVHSAIIIRVV